MEQNGEIQAAIHPLFVVPFMSATLPEAEPLNNELRDLFLALEAQGDAYRDFIQRDTQHRVFESRFDLHRRPEAPVRKLFGMINHLLMGFIRNINGYDDAQMANIEFDMHSWFHVTSTGGFQGTHSHPNASWSAIYCVDPGDPGSSFSGAVRFHDPRIAATAYRDPCIENLKVPYQLAPWQLTHKPGQLLIFPSYLPHEIFPYEGQRPRIVVALNAWGRWKQSPL
ncbi:putative 2OG-Fe(II) oxygenase [Luteimonas sp. e5]